MTILDFNTDKRHKLTIYLCNHLKNKRYEKINKRTYLSFTEEEAREALLSALRVSIKKRDAKEFLSCLRASNG